MKLWSSGSDSPRASLPDDWDDFAPDLSDFFDDTLSSAQEEEPVVPPSPPADEPPASSADDFEIDWDSVWQKEDALWQNSPSPRPAQTAVRTEAPRPAQPAVRTEAPRPAQTAVRTEAPRPAQPALRKNDAFAWENEAPEEAYARGYAEAPRQKTVKKNKKVVKKTYEKAPKSAKNTGKKKHRLRNFMLAMLLLAGLYCTAVFSNIPFIEKWRTIYIETAMGTMTHQWLATAFIPPSVINAVVGNRELVEERQQGLHSDWGSLKDLFDLGSGFSAPWSKLEKHFSKYYPEINEKTLTAYLAKHQSSSLDKDGYLVIDKAGLKDGGTTIETTRGDQVLALDTRNGIIICKVTGEGYVGRLAIVRDPEQVGLALASDYGSAGDRAADIASDNDALLAINASGFYDPNGSGNGGVAHGVVISKGKSYNGDAVGGSYKTIALDKKNRLNIGQYSDLSNFRDAVEFKPALIIDGEQVVSGSAGWGVQPRSAIGQNKDGTLYLLVVDGRAPGYSIGTTIGECAQILSQYGAVQACNLDGGSSSIMVYNGREISRPSAANKTQGRHIPDAFVVYPRS